MRPLKLPKDLSNWSLIQTSQDCSCIACLMRFKAGEVKEMLIDPEAASLGVCPHCGDPSIWGDSWKDFNELLTMELHRKYYLRES